LKKSKTGKIVSKKASAQGKKRYAQIEGWVESYMAARAALKVSGFVSINGKSIQGKALYVKTKALLMARRAGQSASGAAKAPVAAEPAAAPTAAPAVASTE